MRKRLVGAAPAALFLIVLAGCGGGERPSGTGTPTAKQALDDVAEMLRTFEGRKKPPPRKLAEVEPIEPAHPAAYLGLIRKEIVYLWGTPLNATGGDKVLAHEAKAETDGGWVLMQDGTVKEMTAAEFKAAPKSKG